MGDWYVIANIPTSIERDALNAVESYRLDSDGSIATTFTFREGGFDGKVKTLLPARLRARHRLERRLGHAVRVAHQGRLPHRVREPDYQRTIIGREKRDNVWIMARTPQIADGRLEELRDRVGARGIRHERSLRRVPQQWPESANAPPRSAEEECS